MKKRILFGQEARDALKRGIDISARAISTTLGPTGRNAVLGRLDLPPVITNDGATIARNIELEDEIENQGAWIVKEATAMADKKGGDGTTTATVILQKIVNILFELLKDDGSLVTKKVDAIKLKKDVDIWCDKVCEKLREKARPVIDSDILKVAKVSAEYDWLAQMIADIYSKTGKDGFINIEESVKTGYEIFKGIELTGGYHSEYYINNENRECIINSPHILITNQKLDIQAVIPLVDSLVSRKIMEVVIIAPEFTRDLLNRLVTTKVKAGFTAVALKLPTFDKDDILVDIATLTKATFIDKNTYPTYEDLLKAITFESLGTAERAIIGEGKSVIIGGEGDTTERVKAIRKLHSESQSEFDKNTYEKRIAYLSGGIAVLKIGGESDTEKNYFKLKAEDAINAVQVALQEGVVKGGGLALKEIADELPKNILTEAIKAPYNQIQENAGGSLEIGDDIIDPVKITISSLRSACSLAGMVVTTETVTAFKQEEPPKQNYES